MKKVIDPIPKKEILKELNDKTFIRETNYSNHQIFVVNHINSPRTLLEIGRLREITFRNAGGGTGKEVDLDNFDTRSEAYYNQLIVWDPEKEEIIGGYRYIKGSEMVNSKKFNDLATNGLFDFNDDFWMKNIEGIHRTCTIPGRLVEELEWFERFYYGEVLASDL